MTTAAVEASRPLLLELQARLEARGKEHRNWLEPWWDGGQYLDARLSLPISYNYHLRFEDEHAASTVTPLLGGAIDARQVARAARLLRAMAEFAVALHCETAPPDAEGGTVVDMNQFARLFGHARLPAVGGDTVKCHVPMPSTLDVPHFRTTHTTDEMATHVAVLVRGRFFRVEVMAARGGAIHALSAQEIARGLLAALAAAAELGDAPHPIAALTSMDRDAWASARQVLAAASTVNAASLSAIDSSLWVVCLDDAFPVSGAEVVGGSDEPRPLPALGHSTTQADDAAWSARLSAESPRYLAGGGAGGDRYFDKHCLIVSRDGAAALLLEHAAVDGLTVLRLMNYVAAALSCEPAAPGAPSTAQASDAAAADFVGVHPPPRGALQVDVHAAAREMNIRVQHHLQRGDEDEGETRRRRGALAPALPFDVPALLAATVTRARAQLAAAAASLSTSVLHTSAVSRGRIKDGMRLSPDAFAQMAMQLAHAKLSGVPATPTYESTSTRAFANGRTEVTRSASVESAALVANIALAAGAPAAARSSVSTRRRLAALLGEACAAHVRYAREAKAGRGVDRHLMGLRMLALEQAATSGHGELPPIFRDPAYNMSRYWRLSTSHWCAKALSSPASNCDSHSSAPIHLTHPHAQRIRPDAFVWIWSCQ